MSWVVVMASAWHRPARPASKLSLSSPRPGVSEGSGRLDGVTTPDQPPYRSGFACLVGRPNAGKTTLTNALVGEKVGIVSNRPQTTRHAIRGEIGRASCRERV